MTCIVKQEAPLLHEDSEGKSPPRLTIGIPVVMAGVSALASEGGGLLLLPSKSFIFNDLMHLHVNNISRKICELCMTKYNLNIT